MIVTCSDTCCAAKRYIAFYGLTRQISFDQLVTAGGTKVKIEASLGANS